MTEIKIKGFNPKNYQTIVGIDPDTLMSGIAIFSLEKLDLAQMELWNIFDYLRTANKISPIIVRLEAGHTVKSTWHKGGNGMAKRVGANHEIGRQIEKFCKRFNIDYELVKPCGLSSISHETFCKITGWDIKSLTNPEKRVAGLLAYRK